MPQGSKKKKKKGANQDDDILRERGEATSSSGLTGNGAVSLTGEMRSDVTGLRPGRTDGTVQGEVKRRPPREKLETERRPSPEKKKRKKKKKKGRSELEAILLGLLGLKADSFCQAPGYGGKETDPSAG
ncbi:hypothetical protein Q7C36_008434 [Tachysurus vachellii]|uniref:Uncharacterized protein n=1 Tax=Tachysurus vachellii TaxID=175792 RepID=A0AA88N991_TACVA|nr:hypothetical protein Q7C36_008434 [Tachysurus vachellii]